jgi:sporulation protein YlmC with PRC-barrel domain
LELGRDDRMPVEHTTGQLARLSDLDYEMEEGQPDIIGWTVVDERGTDIGKVDDLLVDLDTGSIMLAAIEFDNKHTLVPIESFALDTSNNRLILPVDRTEVESAPLFTEQTEDVSVFFDYWGAGFDEEFEEERRETLG